MMQSEITLENYEEKRRELLEANANLSGIVLREQERRLDARLSALKAEFTQRCGSRNVYDIPVLAEPELCSSPLYRFCTRLPKGADLHVHDMALLPLGELVPLLRTCPELCINADRRSFDLKCVEPDGAPPPGYLRFPDAMESGYYSEAELLESWTVLGAKRSGMRVWDFFETPFARQGVLSDNPGFARKYYDRAFRYYSRCGIQHVEIHLMLTESMDDSKAYLLALREAYYNVKKDCPDFTVRIIGAGVKADNENIELTKRCFLNASYVQEIIKDESDPAHPEDFVIGFDLVNEEDSSLPLHAFAPMLLKVRKQYPEMRLYIHGGESLDAENYNLFDAYLLGVSRVGHGLNLYRYPELHSRYVRSEICLEVCPISNQRLGYTPDLRSHPATEYLRTGAALALCSDDPAYMERQTLTDDFFAAVVCWNLTLSDLKQLGINSLLYSGLEPKRKQAALRAYSHRWNEFVAEELAQLGNT